MDTTGVIQLIILFLLIASSAFFSSAETALTSANRMRIRSMANEGSKSALRVQQIHARYNKMLSTILIGNNVVNISASSIATSMTIRLWGNTAVGIVTGVVTLVVLLFGEIVPKTWAGSHADQIALAYSNVIWGMMTVLTPLVWIVDKLSGGIIILFHLNAGERPENITESELRTYVDVSHEEGILEEEEHDIINNVFDFSDAEAKDIMIPRIDMTTVSSKASYWDVRKIFQDTLYTRLPIYDGDPDNLIGMVHMKDFFFVRNPKQFQLRKIMRPAYYTYELKKTSDLLMEMRNKSMNMAFVLDEYGSAVGMITLEDLLEEIVGEIRDEYDEDEDELIKAIDDRTYLIEGGMKLDDINEALDTSFDSEDYDSIGGLMIEQLGKLPDPNEKVTLEDGTTLQVRGIHQNRIIKVLLTLPEKKEDPEESAEESAAL